ALTSTLPRAPLFPYTTLFRSLSVSGKRWFNPIGMSGRIPRSSLIRELAKKFASFVAMLWLSLLASGVRTSRSECPGQQVIEARLRMACGDGFECVAQVGVGIDAVQLAGLDQGRDPGPAGAAFVVTAKECVLPIQGERTDEVFDRVVVHLDTPVLEEHPQAVPVVGYVADRAAPRRLARQPCARLSGPGVVHINDLA